MRSTRKIFGEKIFKIREGLRPAARVLLVLLQFGFLLSLLHCPKDLPQQDLSEARLQLGAAEEEGASQRETQLYSDSRANLLEAHQLAAAEDFSGAQEKAQVSAGLAMDAREKTMPPYLNSLEKQAKDSLVSMEEKGAQDYDAENFKLAQGSYAKAQEFRKEGDAANEGVAGTQGEQKQILRRKALAQYRNASLAYKRVKSIGSEVEKTLRSQGLDLGETISLAKSELEKARLYGASEAQLQKPGSQISAAQKAHGEKKYAEASKSITAARKDLAALLTQLEPVYARKLLEQAKSSVAKAEEHQKKSDTPEEREAPQKAKALDAMLEQLASAQEARDTAEKFIGEENYSESIKESKDALRLSKVILEQAGLLASGRGGIVTSSGNGLVEDIGEGWKRYTVRDRKPADCLWCIAAQPQVYGSGVLWERIHKANRKKVKNPNVIHPGQVLFIPPPKGPITQPPAPK